MGRKYDFKYLVIGSGAAGAAAAMTLAKAKKRVGLVGGGAFGGAHLNTRDAPYDTTLNFAHTFYKASRLPELRYQDLSFNFPTAAADQLRVINALGGPAEEKRLADAGMIVIRGWANFLDPHTIAVGERKFTSEQFIIATGGELDTGLIEGLELVKYLTPETALTLRQLPKAILIVGGGATGCEIAEYYATLGTQTILLEKEARLLPQEDTEIGTVMETHLTDDLGVMVLTGARAIALAQDRISEYVVFESEHEQKMVRVERTVLATGSKARGDLGIANTGVKISKDGAILVDRYFQTSVKHIWAVGDVAEIAAGKDGKKSLRWSSTECAEYEGRLTATNLISKTKSAANYRGFMRAVNTLPAVATFGANELELKRSKVRYKKATVSLTEVPAAEIYNLKTGFVKILADDKGRVIGGCVVAPGAQEIGNELALAIRHRLKVLEVASTPHIAGGYGVAVQKAARQLVK